MCNNLPLVSIIMPVYNSEKFIVEAINSVLAQTYSNWELIVINDGSSDTSLKLVKGILDKRIIVIEQENSGVSKARNKGIEISKGKYISFLDSDDFWFENKLQKQVDYMETHSDVVLSFSDYISFVGEKKVIKNKQLTPFHINNIKCRLLVFNFIATLTVMVKADLVKLIGGFDELLFGPEDWDLWIKISQCGDIGYINFKLAAYREHSEGISKNKHRQLVEEYKVLSKHILQSNNNKLKKKALWFYSLKLANFYLFQKNYKKFFLTYLKLLKIMPFNINNIYYPLKKIFKI